MNLEELRQEIFELTNYSPDNIDYIKLVDRQINAAYQYILGYKPWIFSIKEAYLDIYPDLVPAQDTASPVADVSATFANGSRHVEFSGKLFHLGFGDYGDTWQGQIFELLGNEYEILSVIGEDEIVLKDPVRTTAVGITESEEWTIKHRYYTLPQDCLYLIRWVQLDRPVDGAGHVVAQAETIINNYNYNSFNRDYAAEYATEIYMEPDLKIPSAGKTVITATNQSDTTMFPDGTYVQLTWCFQKDGKWGPLAEPTPITELNAGGLDYNSITLSCKDITVDSANLRGNVIITDPADWSMRPKPHPLEGLKKAIFFNSNIDQSTGLPLGEPCWVQVNNYHPTNTTTDETQPLVIGYDDYTESIFYLKQLDPYFKRYLSNSIKRVRPYPRINSYDIRQALSDTVYGDLEGRQFKQVAIQYVYKPDPLTLPFDVPEIPVEYHQLIVYKVGENLAIRENDSNQVAHFKRQFENEMKGMESRYSNTVRVPTTRESWGVGDRRFIFSGRVRIS
jgi:hypothetical protein